MRQVFGKALGAVANFLSRVALPMPSSAEILLEMIEELKDLGRSERHIYSLCNDLEPFVMRFRRIDIDDKEIVTYLRELSLKVGPRRRDNIRDAIVQLSRYARRRNYLPEGRRSAAEKIKRIRAGHDVLTWTPAEAALILEHISPRWLPCAAIGMFAGLRKSEILRLDWSAFKWDMKDREGNAAPVIAVSRKVARKIRVDRVVPISPNLAAWLIPYLDRVGPIYPGNFKSNENAHSQEMIRLRITTGLLRKDNANRHTFGSCRLAVTKSYDQVALEMGNSARKVREDYNDPKSEAQGIAYFSISPPSFDNVSPMSLPLEFVSNGCVLVSDRALDRAVAVVESAILSASSNQKRSVPRQQAGPGSRTERVARRDRRSALALHKFRSG